MKVSLEEQISTVERARDYAFDNRRDAPTLSWTERYAIDAALSTLKWVERHQAELRVLGEFPIENVTVREVGE
jgi:hypothetical protein